MLHNMHNLIGFTLGATDGEIGKVKDFYFDDQNWRVKYLVIETGNWLFGRKVLLSPVALQSPNWDSKIFPVNLTKDQIKHSPDIDTDKPVSRQQEEELHNHYSWPYYEGAGMGFMTTGMVGGVVAPGIPFEDKIADEVHHPNGTSENTNDQHATSGDQHLRSFKATDGYTIHAKDDELGEVEDFLVDSATWNIPFLVIETGNWYSGKKIVCSTNHIKAIEWENSAVYVDQTTSDLKNSPEFDFNNPINQETERNLYNYYQTERNKI